MYFLTLKYICLKRFLLESIFSLEDTFLLSRYFGAFIIFLHFILKRFAIRFLLQIFYGCKFNLFLLLHWFPCLLDIFLHCPYLLPLDYRRFFPCRTGHTGSLHCGLGLYYCIFLLPAHKIQPIFLSHKLHLYFPLPKIYKYL